MTTRPMRRIPIAAGRWIAQKYGYDQVIIIGRRVGEKPEIHGEHLTTYGRTREHCSAAAHIGDFLKHMVMGWTREEKAP